MILTICPVWPQIHNISEKDHMKIDMEHLMVNTEYHVAVRAIPVNYLRGSWSEWSKTYIFSTHAGNNIPSSPAAMNLNQRQKTVPI